MPSSVTTAGGTANADVLGDDQKGIPYMQGAKDVQDAAWLIGRTFKGGIPALAQRLGENPETLKKKLNPNCETHRLSVAESVDLQLCAERYDILYAMAWSTDHVCVHVPEADADEIGQRLVTVGAEVGDVFNVARRILADGKIDLGERRELMSHVLKTISALAAVVKGV